MQAAAVRPGTCRPITSVDPTRWAQMAERARETLLPLVVRGALSAEACASAKPTAFAAQYPDKRVNITVNLPAAGSPYWEQSEPHQRNVSMRDFLQCSKVARLVI